MSENVEGKNIHVGKANKLDGISNYQAWKIKIKALFKQESLWEIVAIKTDPTSFLVIIGGMSVSENKLKVMKADAYLVLVLLVKDKLFKVVADIDDLVEQWAKLATKYPAGDTSQHLMVFAKLHTIKMKEGSLVEECFNMAKDLLDLWPRWTKTYQI
jgi:hypothetical protein